MNTTRPNLYSRSLLSQAHVYRCSQALSSAQSIHTAAPTPVRSPHQCTPSRRRDFQDRHRIKTRPCKAARDGVERHRSGALNPVRFSLSTRPHLTANNPTQCSIRELYLRGRSQQPVVDLAKTFERRKFNHKEAIPGDVSRERRTYV